MNSTQPTNLPTYTCQVIEWYSPEYRELVLLREQLFRKPFGLSYSKEELALEMSDRHLAAFQGLDLVGFLSLRVAANEVGHIQLRQMVVRPALQRKGVGTALVTHAEVIARDAGYVTMILDSREESIEFYERLGYIQQGDRFFFKTVMHQKMIKRLAA